MAEREVGFLVVREDELGFDELIGGPCAVHFEMMSDKSLWVGLDHDTDSSKRVMVNIWVERGKLKVRVDDDSDEPPTPPPASP